MTVTEQLAQAAAVGDQKEKVEAYKRVLAGLVAAASEADLQEYVEHSE